MSEMTLEEAQLFRVLGGFFGRDRVVWNMSVRTVCGGVLPAEMADTVAGWVHVAGCLFTIVDHDDTPKMVVEFAPNLSNCIDLQLLERQQQLPRLLGLCGIHYVSMTDAEFQEIIDPQSSLDLASLLRDRLGLVNDDDERRDN
jgi:hypothetical protein